MKTIESLKIEIESFSELKKNWDSYDADEITIQSIITAHKVLDKLPSIVDKQTIDVYSMRNGGIQIDIGEFKEIEIFDYTVTEIQFDSNSNIINKYVYMLN